MKRRLNNVYYKRNDLERNRIGLLVSCFMCTMFIASYSKPVCCTSEPGLESMLLEFTWHLQSSTRYDNDGNITGVYAGTPSDSLLFDLRLDSSSNAYQYSVQKYIASSFDTFNFTLNQTVATNQKVNFLTCAQPWNSGYSDTVKVLPVVDVWHWKYLVFKIGKPNNSAWKVTK